MEEIGRRYGMEVNRRMSQCVVYNGREEMDQIQGIDVVKELKYLVVMLTDRKNVFDRQRENIWKEMKCGGAWLQSSLALGR